MFKDARVIRVNPDHHSVDIEYRSTTERIRDVKCLGRIYWNLQPGDYVLVGFIDNITNPVVIDKVLLRGDPRITESKMDDIHLIHEVGPRDDDGKLTEVTGRVELHTDKDGSLTLKLSGNVGDLKVLASGNVYVGADGNATVAAKGNASVTADGDISAVAVGNLEAKAGGKATIDGSTVELGSNLMKMLVNNLPNCLFTGAPHHLGDAKNVKV